MSADQKQTPLVIWIPPCCGRDYCSPPDYDYCTEPECDCACGLQPVKYILAPDQLVKRDGEQP